MFLQMNLFFYRYFTYQAVGYEEQIYKELDNKV